MRTSVSARSSQKTVQLPSVSGSQSVKVHACPVFPTSNRYSSEVVGGFRDVGLGYTRMPDRRCRNLNGVENRMPGHRERDVLLYQCSHAVCIQVRHLRSNDNLTRRRSFGYSRD